MAIIDLDSDEEIGVSGYTAEELGQKSKFNGKSEDELDELLCDDDELGKLGLALSTINIDVDCD